MKIWEVKMYCGICSCQIWELGQPVPWVLVSLIGWLQWALVSLEGNLPIPGIPLLLENWKYMISIRCTSLSHNQEVRNHKPNCKTIFNNKCFQSCYINEVMNAGCVSGVSGIRAWALIVLFFSLQMMALPLNSKL